MEYELHTNSNNITKVYRGEGALHAEGVYTFTEFHMAAGTNTRWRTSLQLGSDTQLFLRQHKMAAALCCQCSLSPSLG